MVQQDLFGISRGDVGIAPYGVAIDFCKSAAGLIFHSSLFIIHSSLKKTPPRRVAFLSYTCSGAMWVA